MFIYKPRRPDLTSKIMPFGGAWAVSAASRMMITRRHRSRQVQCNQLEPERPEQLHSTAFDSPLTAPMVRS